MIFLKEESRNVFEKYGLEFSGNCYACDLAELKIEKDTIIFLNVCDNQSRLKFRIIRLDDTENVLKIKTENIEFTFSKIDDVPIYELKISGKGIKNKDF